MRNHYTKEVVAAFEVAQGHAELICLYQNFEPQLGELLAGDDYDRMAHEIIHARYHALHERIDESHAWVSELEREFIRSQDSEN